MQNKRLLYYQKTLKKFFCVDLPTRQAIVDLKNQFKITNQAHNYMKCQYLIAFYEMQKDYIENKKQLKDYLENMQDISKDIDGIYKLISLNWY